MTDTQKDLPRQQNLSMLFGCLISFPLPSFFSLPSPATSFPGLQHQQIFKYIYALKTNALLIASRLPVSVRWAQGSSPHCLPGFVQLFNGHSSEGRLSTSLEPGCHLLMPCQAKREGTGTCQHGAGPWWQPTVNRHAGTGTIYWMPSRNQRSYGWQLLYLKETSRIETEKNNQIASGFLYKVGIKTPSHS